MKRLGEAAPSTQAERRATNRQGNRSGLLHSGERFSLCQERFPPAARNPPAYDIGQTTRNSSTAPHVEYADRHCRQKKFADNRFAANPGSIRSLSRFLYADHMHAPENVRNKTLRRNGPRYPYRRTKISEAMKKIPIPFLLSLLLFLTVPACRHTRQSPIRNGSAPEVARLGGKLFGNPTLPRPWYGNRKADALREQIPAAYPLRERRDERNRRRIRLGYHGRNHHAARRGFPIRLSCGREPSHSVRTERQSAWSSRLGERGTLMPRPLPSHSSGKSNSSCPHCGCSRSAGLPILSPSSLTLP